MGEMRTDKRTIGVWYESGKVCTDASRPLTSDAVSGGFGEITPVRDRDRPSPVSFVIEYPTNKSARLATAKCAARFAACVLLMYSELPDCSVGRFTPAKNAMPEMLSQCSLM